MSDIAQRQAAPDCPITKTIKALRQTRIETIYHPQTVGFLAQDEEIEHREIGPGYVETEAIRLLEGVTRYLCHDVGCSANDMDYLDDMPCTCGLRLFYNPKGGGVLVTNRAAIRQPSTGDER